MWALPVNLTALPNFRLAHDSPEIESRESSTASDAPSETHLLARSGLLRRG